MHFLFQSDFILIWKDIDIVAIIDAMFIGHIENSSFPDLTYFGVLVLKLLFYF